MPTTRIQLDKNVNGRPEIVKVYEGNRLILHLVYGWAEDELHRIDIKKGNLSLADRFNLLDRKFIERIEVIDDIVNIENIETIEHATIDEITTIRDINYSPPFIVANPSFDSGELAWTLSGRASILSSALSHGIADRGILKFAIVPFGGAGAAYQRFITPIKASELSSLTFWAYVLCATGDITVDDSSAAIVLYYTDGTTETTTFSFAAGQTWELKTAAKTNSKYVWMIAFVATANDHEIYVDDLWCAKATYESAVYKEAQVTLNADGNIIAGVAGKVIKVHQIKFQALATMELDVKDDSGGNILDHFKGQDREGDESSHIAYPQCHYKSAVGKPLYADFSTAANCFIKVVYTDSDAS